VKARGSLRVLAVDLESPDEFFQFSGAPGFAALDAYIDNVRRTATWNRLVVEYFGDSAPEVLRKAQAE